VSSSSTGWRFRGVVEGRQLDMERVMHNRALWIAAIVVAIAAVVLVIALSGGGGGGAGGGGGY
jgi:hypothetical protein